MQEYRCTACGTVTTSSKACPKCGRRSTLVPLSEAEAGLSPQVESRSERSKRDTRILFGALLVAVVSSITALVLALGRFGDDKPSGHSPDKASAATESLPNSTSHSPQSPQYSARPPRPGSRVAMPPSTQATGRARICGMRYCLTTELQRRSASSHKAQKGRRDAPDKQGNKAGDAPGTMVTTHCFLTEDAPTRGRMWYVVTSHALQWKRPDQPPQNILTVRDGEISLAPGAEKWLGDLARAFQTDRSPVGRRLFYLQETRWGFALGAPPTAPDPVTLQMALLAATSAAMTPNPPAPDQDRWTDQRLLLLPVRAPARVWRRTTKPGAKLVRWTILGKDSPAGSTADHAREKVSLKGVAQALDGHLDKVRIDWSSNEASGRLLLVRKGEGCLGDEDRQAPSPPKGPGSSKARGNRPSSR